MPFAIAPAAEVMIGTSEMGEKPEIPTTIRPNIILDRPIVLRMAQLSSKYSGTAAEVDDAEPSMVTVWMLS